MPIRPRSKANSGQTLLLAIRIGVLGVLIYWSFILVQPFIPILAWSVVLTVALYPAYRWLSVTLGGRPKLAAVVLTLLILLVVVGPVAWIGAGLADGLRDLSRGLDEGRIVLPSPPPGIRQWPLVGQTLYDLWSSASENLELAFRKAAPHIRPLASYVLAFAGGAGIGMLKFLLSIVLSAFLFPSAPRVTAAVRELLTQLVAERSEYFLVLATKTIRSVSEGVIGIAMLQALLTGIALKVAGVPSASILAFAVLMLCILQIGPAIILLPVIIWVWTSKETGVAIAMTVFLGIVGLADNILKPIVMGRELRTPMLVIFIGVLGGTLAHGLVGLFIGPIVLAVAWEILVAWIGERRADVVLAPDPKAEVPNTEIVRGRSKAEGLT